MSEKACDSLSVVSLELWKQSSSDYDAVRRTASLAVSPDTTVGEIFAWAKRTRENCLASGDLVLVAAETAAGVSDE